ncbi:MAG: hypothetical protein U0164_09555 [Gemmatimonadaceae bacterium]
MSEPAGSKVTSSGVLSVAGLVARAAMVSVMYEKSRASLARTLASPNGESGTHRRFTGAAES